MSFPSVWRGLTEYRWKYSVYANGYVIYVQGEQQWTENGALRDTRHNRGPVRFNTINYYPLLPEAQKSIYPFQCLSTYTITKQFAFKKFMWRGVKSFFKVQNKSVNLTLFVQYFCPIIYYCNQLSFTTMSFPECMLFVRQKIILVKMTHDI